MDVPVPMPHSAPLCRSRAPVLVAHAYNTSCRFITRFAARHDAHRRGTLCRRRLAKPASAAHRRRAALRSRATRARRPSRLAVLLNKRFGLLYGKNAALLRDRFVLTVTRRGWSTPSIAPPGRRSLSLTCRAQRCAAVRWLPPTKPAGVSMPIAVLWAFVTPETTGYAIQPDRGLAQAAHVIGVD